MASCRAPAPETAAEAISGLASRGPRAAYREEIYHPALAVPEVARGTMAVDAEGRLVRHQTVPVDETAIIGVETVTILGEATGAVEILPIPDDLAPFLEVLRLVATGRAGELAGREGLRLETNPGGWRVALGGARQPILWGCGTRLHGLEVEGVNGGAQVIRFIGDD